MFRHALTGTALLIAAACTDGRGIAAPTGPALTARDQSPGRAAERKVGTSGHFDALVDFSTLTLTPRGRNCLLQVRGQLVFTGTIAGTATGQTTALVSAPCADVATTPPGTFSDVFKSELTFEGTVAGASARADMRYIGRVQPGGAIEAHLVLSNGVSGVLDVIDGVVAVGGDYSGAVVVH
jgi:hypothetical protein